MGNVCGNNQVEAVFKCLYKGDIKFLMRLMRIRVIILLN
jgi:hypothetical protein